MEIYEQKSDKRFSRTTTTTTTTMQNYKRNDAVGNGSKNERSKYVGVSTMKGFRREFEMKGFHFDLTSSSASNRVKRRRKLMCERTGRML